MDHREYMGELLRRTGLYRMDGTTQVDRELDAYMAGLEILYDAVDERVKDAFLQTAGEQGLSYAESAYAMNGDGLSLEERRKRLLLRRAVRSESREDMLRLLESQGIYAGISDNFAEQSICVMPRPGTAKDQIRWLRSVFSCFLPVHLELVVDTRLLTWEALEAFGYTWEQIDQKQKSWEDLDDFSGTTA